MTTNEKSGMKWLSNQYNRSKLMTNVKRNKDTQKTTNLNLIPFNSTLGAKQTHKNNRGIAPTNV